MLNIKATEKDITLKGSEISSENVNLDAKENINVIAGTNKNVGKGENSSSSASIGVSIGLGGITGINAGYNKANGEVKENAETHVASTITAKDTLTTKSGQDTNIIGSKLEGETINMEVGKDLNIESLQDKETYDEKNNSSGFNFRVDVSQPKGKPATYENGGITGGKNKGNTNSNYESVTDQAGIYAGKGGFDIEVGKNTDLKGAVIASEADASKNKLSTDTLTYSDIENKADYSASSVGVNINTSKDAKLNEKGITPNIGVPAKGDASSTTKSAISNGTIEIRNNPKQDISDLSRDTSQALNQLGKIFDKKTVQEKQELANLFGQLAFEAVGQLAAKKQIQSTIAKKNADDYEKAAQDALKNGDTKNAEMYENIAKQYRDIVQELAPWQEGGANKIALHALVGGLMSEFGGSGFGSGAVGAGVNELVQKELSKIKDPDVHQWASALVGATTAKIVEGDAKTGASTAVSGTKNNYLGEEYVNSAVNWIVDNGKDAIKSNINNLIETGMLSNPKDMEHDYRIIMAGASLPIKFMGLASGYILDKHGNIYALIEGDGGFGVSTPIQITDGFGDFNTQEKEDSDDYRRAIEGWSFGGGGAAGIQISTSISSSGIVGSEVTGTTAMGTTLFSGRYVQYLFNLYE